MATFSLGYNNYTVTNFKSHTTAHSVNNQVNKAKSDQPTNNVGSGKFSDGSNPEVFVDNITANTDFRGGSIVGPGRADRKADGSSRSTIAYGGGLIRDAVVKNTTTTKTFNKSTALDRYPGYTRFGTEGTVQYLYASNFAGFISYFPKNDNY